MKTLTAILNIALLGFLVMAGVDLYVFGGSEPSPPREGDVVVLTVGFVVLMVLNILDLVRSES